MNPFDKGDLKATFTCISNVGKGQERLEVPEDFEAGNGPESCFLRQLLCRQETRLGLHHSSELVEHDFFESTGFDWNKFEAGQLVAPVRPTSTLQERYTSRPGQNGVFYFDEVPEYKGEDLWCNAFCRPNE